MGQPKLTAQIKIRCYPGMKRALSQLAAKKRRKPSEVGREAIEKLIEAEGEKAAA